MKFKNYFLIFTIIFLIFFSFSFVSPALFNSEKTCGDGSLNGECSNIEPYFCFEGILIENISFCGCPDTFNLTNGNCFSQYQTNPKNISLKYILKGKEGKINFTVYEGMTEYLYDLPKSISYLEGEEPKRIDFKLRNLDEEKQRDFLLPLIVTIQNLDKDKENQVRIAISMVQNMEWGWSNKTVNFGGNKINYSRYSYESLYDTQGVCGEKSGLLAFILRELGYDVAIFYNQKENHESVGIKCPLKNSWNGSGYCFIETSGPAIISDTSINYVNGIKITSEPDVLNLSKEGDSLRKGLREYRDAKSLMKIREKISNNKRINIFYDWKFKNLYEKYSLVDKYNLG